MEIQITNYAELLEFISRKNINARQATKLISKSIGVYCYGQDGKEEIIRQLQEYWIKFGHLPIGERPLFLNQKEVEFSIKDIYN